MEDLEHIVSQKVILLELNNHNIETINKIKKMLTIIDQVEQSFIKQVSKHVSDTKELDNHMQENIDLFKIICANLKMC